MPQRLRKQTKLREAHPPACFQNDCRGMAFMATRTFKGQRLKVLTIIDPFARVSPAMEVRRRVPGNGVRTLAGHPRVRGPVHATGQTMAPSSCRRQWSSPHKLNQA